MGTKILISPDGKDLHSNMFLQRNEVPKIYILVTYSSYFISGVSLSSTLRYQQTSNQVKFHIFAFSIV